MDKKFLEDCLEKGMSTRDIEKICDKDHRTISYWINKYDLNNKSIYKKNDSYKFNKIDTKEKAYTLGFLLADAGINKDKIDISVAMADKYVVEFLSSIVNGNVHYDFTLDKKARRFPRARMTKRIADITKFTGGYKKEDRHYPRVREDLEKYLIQGLFDSDGCITWGRRKDKNRIWQKISFTSQLKILEGVQQYLLKKLEISTVVRPKSNNGKCYVLEFSNLNDVLKFCKHIYSDNFIILERKYLKYNALRLELEDNGEGAEKLQ